MILDDDPDAHLRHIKLQPKVEPEVGGCVEHGDGALARELEDDFDYEGVQTCAVDGMCQTACPVLINTGDLVKRLRRDGNSRVADAAWASAA